MRKMGRWSGTKRVWEGGHLGSRARLARAQFESQPHAEHGPAHAHAEPKLRQATAVEGGVHLRAICTSSEVSLSDEGQARHWGSLLLRVNFTCETFCEAADRKKTSIASAISGFQDWTNTSTPHAALHGATTSRWMDPSQVRHKRSSPGAPDSWFSARLVYVPTRPYRTSAEPAPAAGSRLWAQDECGAGAGAGSRLWTPHGAQVHRSPRTPSRTTTTGATSLRKLSQVRSQCRLY